jgi:hypothetical protein
MVFEQMRHIDTQLIQRSDLKKKSTGRDVFIMKASNEKIAAAGRDVKGRLENPLTEAQKSA